MSDAPQGQGWWQATDGKWYPPQPAAPPPGPSTPGQYGPGPGQYGAGPGPGPYGPGPGPYGAGAGPGQYGGYPQQGWVAPVTSGLAVASLVLSILWLGGLGSILAVIFGIVALSQIRSSGGRKGGAGLATVGLVIGGLGIVGSVLFFVLIAEVGTSLSRDLTPTVLNLGQAGSYSAQDNPGVVSVTVESVSFGVTSDNPLITPSPNTEFAAAKVKECAGSDGVQGGLSSFGWQLIFPSGSTVASTLDARNPGLDTFNALGADQCVVGFVTFEVPTGSSPSLIEYEPIFVHPYEWRLSGT